jgi:hypothetical protein
MRFKRPREWSSLDWGLVVSAGCVWVGLLALGTQVLIVVGLLLLVGVMVYGIFSGKDERGS